MGTMRRPPAVSAAPGPVPAAPQPDHFQSAEHLRPEPAGTTLRPGRSRVRSLVVWVALLWLGLVYLSIPELRPGLRAFLELGATLGLWFFAARTKTLSGQFLGTFFALTLPWALVIGLIGPVIAEGPARIAVDDLGAVTVIAAVTEQSLLFAPLLLLAVLFPVRARGFSAADWLLTGLAAGLGLQAIEELARRDAETGVLTAEGADRGVLTALLGVTVGLAIAAWRHSGKSSLGPAARTGWRVLAVLVPLSCWWVTVSVQAGANATRVVGPAWSAGADSTFPWWLPLGWSVGGHGAGLEWVLLVLFLIAMLVDAGRLRNAAEEADDPLPYPFEPSRAADQWAESLTRWAGTRTGWLVAALVWLIAAACAVLAYAVRDLVVVLVSYARAMPGGRRRRPPRRPRLNPAAMASREAWREVRRPPEEDPDRSAGRESRWSAIGRGCVGGVMVRTIRAEAIALAAGPNTPVARRITRVVAALGLLVVALVTVWLSPRSAERIGDGGALLSSGTAGPVEWLGGTLTAFTPWWSALAPWQYLVIGLGLPAAMIVSASPLDLPWLFRRSIWFSARTPAGTGSRERIGSYLWLSSPTELVVDGVGLVLTLVPPGLPQPSTGEAVRAAVAQFRNDPVAFIADRRAAARAAAHHRTNRWPVPRAPARRPTCPR